MPSNIVPRPGASAILIPFPSLAQRLALRGRVAAQEEGRKFWPPLPLGAEEEQEQRRADCASYRLTLWGELIYGSKEQLQAFGIGNGKVFPGEPGGPVRSMTVLDPRGLRTEIDFKTKGDLKVYCARINYDKRVTTNDFGGKSWSSWAPGVQRRESVHSDEYVGSADALVASGLLERGQFPGLPGMRKVRVSIGPDGYVIGGPPTSGNCCRTLPGAKVVESAGRRGFTVSVAVPHEVGETRRLVDRAREDELRARGASMKRPPPLRPGGGCPPN